jgi:hypothetical protein
MKRSQSNSSYKPWKTNQKHLLVLNDQSDGKLIFPEDFGINSRSGTWDTKAYNFIRVNDPAFSALNITPHLKPDIDNIQIKLEAGGIIGAVPLKSPDNQKVVGGVVVKPRFGWDGYGPLLNAIGWSASPEFLKLPLVPGSAREIPPWVIAGPLIRRIAQLLKEISRGFEWVEEVRQSPRGQILWQNYISKQIAHGAFHQLPCRFPELGSNNLLRSYLRWGLEKIRFSLIPQGRSDAVARILVGEADNLLYDLHDVVSKIPDRNTIDHILINIGLPSSVLRDGLEALGWIIEERGLAGNTEMDGLSWRLQMHELFERWVECIARHWSSGFGGTGDARVPIRWNRPGTGSLIDLAPDIVVRNRDTVFILDAKYKNHLEELDDQRWRELSENMKIEHRHDLHQVMAYASLYDASRVVSLLVYPIFQGSWMKLADSGKEISRAYLPVESKQIEVGLIGIPLGLPIGVGLENLSKRWNELLVPLGTPFQN